MTLEQDIVAYTPPEPKPLAVIKRMMPEMCGEVVEGVAYGGRFARNLLVDASSFLWIPTGEKVYHNAPESLEPYANAPINSKRRFDVSGGFAGAMVMASILDILIISTAYVVTKLDGKAFEPGFFTKYAGVFLGANALSLAYEGGRAAVLALCDKYSTTKQEMIDESKALVALPSLEADVIKVYDEFREKGGKDEEFAIHYFGDSAASDNATATVDVDGEDTIGTLESRLKSEKEARLQRLADLHNEREVKYAHIQKLLGVKQ